MGNYTRSIGKVLATTALLAVLAVCIALSFALLPLIFAMVFTGRAKLAPLMELIPIAAILGLLYRIWRPTPEASAAKGRTTTTVEKTVIIPTTAADYDRQFEKSLEKYHRQRERERESDDIPF